MLRIQPRSNRHRPPFPDRHVLLEPVHELREQGHRLAAMPSGHPNINRRLAHRNSAHAMDYARRQTRMFCRERFEQPADFAHRHFRVGLVFERGDGLAVFLTAHHAAKFQPRAGRSACRRKNIPGDWRSRQLYVDFHLKCFNRPTPAGLMRLHRRQQNTFLCRCIPSSAPAG